MANLVEYLDGEQLVLARVTTQDRRKVSVTDARGRSSSVPPDKVLFRHTAGSVEELAEMIEALSRDVDVPLLWESVRPEGQTPAALAPAELARLYFDDDTEALCSAIFRALSRDRLHFRRRGAAFEPRSAEDLSRLKEQREAEERVARELAELQQALRPEGVDAALGRRLDRYLRGAEDRQLGRALESRFADPQAGAFELLRQAGLLPPAVSLPVLQANLRQEHPEAVLAHAASLQLPSPRGTVERSAFSIDDEQTREVDDALQVRQEGELVRVDIDIADVASLVQAGDPADREAQRRATTVYLPTGRFYMLPERIGCDLASLTPGQKRPALRTSAWLDSQGNVLRCELVRTFIRIDRRLSYDEADRLLARPAGVAGPERELARDLSLLEGLANALAAHRRQQGALFLRRREWKISVSADGAEIRVHPVPANSPSRALVAEMMILANALAAREAGRRSIPIIYRIQPPPGEPVPEVLPDAPAAFEALRRFIKPAALSLHPAEHWGLGLSAYTQVTSPLRRFADLVVQRQLCAALASDPLPYSAEELLRVLATAEATEREIKRLEAVEAERWALEYLARLPGQTSLEAMVLGEHQGGGHRVEMSDCGAVGILVDDRRHDPGELVQVDIRAVKPGQGVLRLLPSSRA